MNQLLLSVWSAMLVFSGGVSAVEFSTVEAAGKRVTVCRVDLSKERLQLFHRDERGEPWKRFERLAAWLEPQGKKLVFAISEVPVNFHEFATLFRDTLKCPDALYLDGVVSSLYSPQLKRNDGRKDLGPIIGVTE